MIFSCIIPASKKDAESQMLKDLITSIRAQDFPQDQIEILVITEGDSESAKAIGIRRAQGEICAMFCADNLITDKNLFTTFFSVFRCDLDNVDAIYPWRYSYRKNDNSLNRYFSLIGGNDPICYYLGKNDRQPHVLSLKKSSNYQPSYGCNGFFYRSEAIKKTNLDNYYPMDNAMEIKGHFYPFKTDAIWHRTSDNLFTFLRKRYRYARDLFSNRQDRRWKIIDTREDYWKLGLFIFFTLTFIQPLFVSIRGYRKIPDFAWFWHWPVSVGFLITYSLLAFRNLFKYGNFFQRRSINVIPQN